IVNGSFMLDCILPVSESLDYPIRLASATSGKGSYYQEFHGYRVIPPELGKSTPFRGIDPADRAKWILYARGAITEGY
ncbi:MAG: GTP-binding protein, partial [Clostridiales bacterium]|nr:GTP-binding protein [Clostridiales bacterium]